MKQKKYFQKKYICSQHKKIKVLPILIKMNFIIIKNHKKILKRYLILKKKKENM